MIHLTYLWLSSPDLAIKRVAQRVAQGGHFIPEETIKRRYYLGACNIILHYLPLADRALFLDNTSDSTKIMAEKNLKGSLKITNSDLWEELQGLSYAKR